MIKVSELRLQTACLLFITAVLAGVSAYWLRPVLVPLVLAVFVVSGITPILDFLEKSIASSRFTAAAIAFLFGALVLNILAASLWGSVTDLAQNMSQYQSSYEELKKEFRAMFSLEAITGYKPPPNRLKKLEGDSDSFPPDDSERFLDQDGSTASTSVVEDESKSQQQSDLLKEDSSSDDEQLSDAAADEPDTDGGSPEETRSADIDTQDNDSTDPVAGRAERNSSTYVRAATPEDFEQDTEAGPTLDSIIGGMIQRGFRDISEVFVEIISTSLIVLIYVFFLMLGVPTESDRPHVLNEIDHQIRSYLSLKTVISIFTGLIFGLALWFFGIPMALAFGMMACLLNFIPNIGPIIASLLPLPLIVLHPGASIVWITFVIFVTSGIQFISGNVIEPRLMGKSSDLHPIVVLVSLMFWGMLWGIVGMFLAVPITSGIRIALSEFDQTKGIAELMAGRWPKQILAPSTTEEQSAGQPA